MAEVSFATGWNSSTLPAEDGSKLAIYMRSNADWASRIHRRATEFFESNPLNTHLTFVCGGQIIPPDTEHYKVPQDTLQRIGLLLGDTSDEVLKENGHLSIYAIGGDTPVVLHQPLPAPVAMRDVPRIASYDSLMRRHKAGFAIGVGYLAISKIASGIVSEAGYGNPVIGERRYKILDFGEANRIQTLRTRHTETLPIGESFL